MKGLSMLKIKEILRLKCEAKLSNRKIARALNISHSVVNEYTKEFTLTNKRYEDIISLGDKEILSLFKATRVIESKYPLPDFAKVHIELRNPIVTLTLLHEEWSGNLNSYYLKYISKQLFPVVTPN